MYKQVCQKRRRHFLDICKHLMAGGPNTPIPGTPFTMMEGGAIENPAIEADLFIQLTGYIACCENFRPRSRG